MMTEKERKTETRDRIVCIVVMVVLILAVGGLYDWDVTLMAYYLAGIGVFALLTFAGHAILELLVRFFNLFRRKHKCPLCHNEMNEWECSVCRAWICDECSIINLYSEQKCTGCGKERLTLEANSRN